MKYRKYIESRFLIDEPSTGQLVPFKFRPIQNRYYDLLQQEYDIEKNGLAVPVRELILKARRQGFSSFVLALFAADDILSENPTETFIISYRDDATATFRKRYRNFILSSAAIKQGISVEDIQKDPNLLEQFKKHVFSVDSNEYELKHNRAHFYCGTASARVGGRGGTVQKLLFSEAAFYPDKKELKAREIIEGTLRQVDVESCWVFEESTANGDFNHYYRQWQDAESGHSRFRPRFFGWQDYYTPEQFEIIKSEFTDRKMIKQEYPATPEEAFITTGDRFFDSEYLENFRLEDGRIEGQWTYYDEYKPGHRYAIGADVSEGVGRHNSTIVVIDFDAQFELNGRIFKKPKVVAVYANNMISPDVFAHEIANAGNRYGSCIVAPERNNHGFATLTVLKDRYFNIYKTSDDRLGWRTDMASKPTMLHELKTALNDGLIEIPDRTLKQELISYPHQDLNRPKVDEEDESQGHYDRVIALAIAWQMRSLATPSMTHSVIDSEHQRFQSQENFDRHSPIATF